MIQEKIEMFDLVFNHYPKILRRKEPFGPVLLYQYKTFNYRIDLTTKVKVEKETVRYIHHWHVSGTIVDGEQIYNKYDTFKEAYDKIKRHILQKRLWYIVHE